LRLLVEIWSWDKGEALQLRLLVEVLMEAVPKLTRGELDEVRKKQIKETQNW
jgi:hypothetical protein